MQLLRLDKHLELLWLLAPPSRVELLQAQLYLVRLLLRRPQAGQKPVLLQMVPYDLLQAQNSVLASRQQKEVGGRNSALVIYPRED